MGCARTDHPGCGSSWCSPCSLPGAPHTLLPPQGESWGPQPWAQNTPCSAQPTSGTSPAPTVSLEGWQCPEPYQSPAPCPASTSACVMAYLDVSLHTTATP